MQQRLAQLGGLGEIALGRPLFDAQLPAVVVDYIGIVYVRADEEAVVRLGVVAELREADVGDLAREEHTAGLAADGAGAYHAVAHGEVVARLEHLADEPLHKRVAAHHALEQYPLGVRVEAALAEFQLGLGEKAVVAVVVLVLRVGGDVVQQPVIPAQRDAAVQRLEGAAVYADVRDIRVYALAVLRLQRVDVHRGVRSVDVYHQLGRVAYARHGLEAVAAAQQREIGHRLQLVEVGAGHAEEVAHHLVGVPSRLQLAQAVEDVEAAGTLLSDAVVYGHGKRLEARVRVELIDLQPGHGVEQHFLPLEVDVHHVAPVGDRLGDKGQREKAEFLQPRNLPDDVVADAYIVQHLVRAGIAALYLVEKHSRASLSSCLLYTVYSKNRGLVTHKVTVCKVNFLT